MDPRCHQHWIESTERIAEVLSGMLWGGDGDETITFRKPRPVLSAAHLNQGVLASIVLWRGRMERQAVQTRSLCVFHGPMVPSTLDRINRMDSRGTQWKCCGEEMGTFTEVGTSIECSPSQPEGTSCGEVIRKDKPVQTRSLCLSWTHGAINTGLIQPKGGW